MRSNSFLSRMCASFVLFALVSIVHASNFVVSEAHQDEINTLLYDEDAEGGIASHGQDFIYIRPPNTNGISYNKFSAFAANNPLKLVNISRGTDSDEKTGEASIIVIEAPHFDLANTIEIVGPAADILLISTDSTGTIDCIGCEFKNVYRVTLASANHVAPLDDNLAAITKLTPSSNGAVSIFGLKAPGALAVEILAARINLNGTISTHIKVKQDPMGGFTEDKSGTLKMGTGGVNLLIGDLEWDYDAREILKVNPTTTTHALHGYIESVAVKVSASNPLVFNTVINTKTDLLSTIRHNGNTNIAPESIYLQSFSIVGGIVLNNSYQTDGEILIQSNSDLAIPENATITAPNVTLVARGAVNNLSKIETDTIAIGGGSVLNRAYIQAFEKIEVVAQNNLVNSFGGQLVSPEIFLESKSGIVRNGSRYPYLVNVDEAGQPLNVGAEADLDDPIHLGTFYRNDVQVNTEEHKLRPEHTYSHIWAKNLKIKASALENINPYWIRVDESGGATIDLTLSNQVSLSGEQSIWIDTSSYVLNSSAVMRVNDVAGLLAMKSGSISNERYRTFNFLDVETDANGTPVAHADVIAKAYAISPPGLMMTMGKLQMDAAVGFLNEISYLEVFGDAEFQSPSVRDVGIKYEGAATRTYLETVRGPAHYSNCPIYLLDSCGRIYEVEVSEHYLPDATELDSLFFIHGNIKGEQAAFASSKYDPFNKYVNMAADSLYQNEFRHARFTVGREYLGPPYGEVRYEVLDKDKTVSYDVKDDYLQVKSANSTLKCNTRSKPQLLSHHRLFVAA